MSRTMSLNTIPRPVRILLALGILGAIAGLGFLAYIWFTGGSGEASAAISAPTLEAPAAGNVTVFEIVPEESEARFLIYEELFGSPKTVVGRTDQVAGQISIDFDNPAASELGTVRVNVRTMATDNEYRNRALRGQILRSNEFEFAQFTPTSIEGLPESITMNTPYTFTITGDLTIRDITQPVTFEARVTPISEQRLHGFAEATITREPFGLTIPNAPGVANVGEEVGLEIEFVAQSVQ